MNRLQSIFRAAIGFCLLAALAHPALGISRQIQSSAHTSVNRNVNVDVDVHGGYCCYHPVATAAAVTTAAVVTAAAVGSIVHTLPPACPVTVINGITYQNCGGTWYQPQYAGTSVQYVVVTAPR